MTFLALSYRFQENAYQRLLLRRYMARCRARMEWNEIIDALPIMSALNDEAVWITNKIDWEC